MPHSFGCETSCGSSCKKFRTWSQQLSFWMEPLFFRYLKHCSVSSIPVLFLKCNVISTFCAVDQVNLVCGTC